MFFSSCVSLKELSEDKLAAAKISGTVLIFNVPEKNTVLPWRPFHLSRFWLGVPDLSKQWQTAPSAAVCLLIGGQKLAQILSVSLCTRKIAGSWGSAPNPSGELTTLSQTPKSEPRRSLLRRSHRIVVPRLWSPYFFTSLTAQCERFLKEFQTNAPLAHCLYDEIRQLLRTLMKRILSRNRLWNRQMV